MPHRLAQKFTPAILASLMAASVSQGTTVVFIQDVEIIEDGQGVGQVYAGTHDAELRKDDPDTNYDEGTGSSNPEFNVDELGYPAESHVVLRFDDLFGHVPSNAVITNATLFIDIDDTGHDMSLYRLAPGVSAWTETTVTWNNLGSGSDGVGIGADTTGSATTVNGLGNKVYIDATADVQAWHGGATNNGWAFLPGGTNSVDFDASENTDQADRPALTIMYRLPDTYGAFSYGSIWQYQDDGSDLGTVGRFKRTRWISGVEECRIATIVIM